MSECLIRLSNVSRSYSVGDAAVHALQDINLDVHQGEQMAIVGPSGSGKSTLMNIMGLLEKPSLGQINFDGTDVMLASQDDRASIRNRSIGFVFQQFHLIPHLTAAQNVELPLRYQQCGRHERNMRAADSLRAVGLTQRLHHRPNQLSGGERQRVAIARALVSGPKLILADEPTGALDSNNGQAVLDLMLDLSGRLGVTLVMITHDQSLAARLPRRMELLDGRIIKATPAMRKVVAAVC
jgi:putative ABC transport system ATP-binding protein